MFSSEADLGLKKYESRKVASAIQLFALHYGDSAICSTLWSILSCCTNTAPPQVLQEQFGFFFYSLNKLESSDVQIGFHVSQSWQEL